MMHQTVRKSGQCARSSSCAGPRRRHAGGPLECTRSPLSSLPLPPDRSHLLYHIRSAGSQPLGMAEALKPQGEPEPRASFLTDPFTSRDLFGVCRGRCLQVRGRPRCTARLLI